MGCCLLFDIPVPLSLYVFNVRFFVNEIYELHELVFIYNNLFF